MPQGKSIIVVTRIIPMTSSKSYMFNYTKIIDFFYTEYSESILQVIIIKEKDTTKIFHALMKSEDSPAALCVLSSFFYSSHHNFLVFIWQSECDFLREASDPCFQDRYLKEPYILAFMILIIKVIKCSSYYSFIYFPGQNFKLLKYKSVSSTSSVSSEGSNTKYP